MSWHAIVKRDTQHDSLAAIPLSLMTAERVTNCYDLMDAAYCSSVFTDIFRSVVPTTLNERKKYEQVCKSIARYMALSISFGVGSEVQISDTPRAGRARGL